MKVNTSVTTAIYETVECVSQFTAGPIKQGLEGPGQRTCLRQQVPVFNISPDPEDYRLIAQPALPDSQAKQPTAGFW